jgi:regulator of protease activity HflC (stomatin/prohibitin superfamily)
LRQSEALAAQQPALTASKVAIEVAANTGEAQVARSRRDAEATVLTAQGEAQRVRLTGQADADRITAVGVAQANAAEAQVRAYGGAEIAMRKAIAEVLSDAIKHAAQPMVPRVVMGPGQASMPDLLLSLAAADGSIGRAINEDADAVK